MRKIQYLTALFFAATLVVIGCATPGDAPRARSGRAAGVAAETELREQLERAQRQLTADAETMERQQREIKALTEWIERFTSDPREMLTQLRVQNAHLKKQLRAKFGRGPRGVAALVKSVKGSLVVLSVGSNDGVRNGDTYQIRRGSSYVGPVTVTTVYKDQCVGTFDGKFQGPAAPPQAGDQAQTPNRSPALRRMEKELRNARFWLNKYREKSGDGSGPIGAYGVVKTVKGNLVVLSVGSDDGVRSGDTYQIRRGASYVGQITISNVYKDQSVGTFDSKFKGPSAPPQAGDAADPKNY